MSYLDFGDNPADWIVRGGKPAACMGERGWPSYEDEEGRFYIYELLLLNTTTGDHVMALPHKYITDAVNHPGGLVALGGEERWRPKVHMYAPLTHGGWAILGSQQELAWRHGLHWASREAMANELAQMINALAEGHPELGIERADLVNLVDRIPEAERKADALLQECLTPYQLFEYRVNKRFRVTGGRTGNTYMVGLGDGFTSIDPLTEEVIQGYCFHPDNWIPHEDVALAIKMCLEDEALELDALERSRPGEARWAKHGKPSREQKVARAIERGGM